MTEKYTLPSISDVLEAARTEEGCDSLVSNFRTTTGNMSIKDVVSLRIKFDQEIGEFVERIDSALQESYANSDYEVENNLWCLKQQVIEAYGYDSFDDGTWVNSNY